MSPNMTYTDFVIEINKYSQFKTALHIMDINLELSMPNGSITKLSKLTNAENINFLAVYGIIVFLIIIFFLLFEGILAWSLSKIIL